MAGQLQTYVTENAVAMLDPLNYIQTGSTQEYLPLQTIFSPTTKERSFFLVSEGVVVIQAFSKGGQVITLDVLRAEELFGEEIFLGAGYKTTALSLTSTKIMSWPQKVMENKLVSSPDFAAACFCLMIRRHLVLCERMRILGTLKLSQRIAANLVMLAEKFGVKGPAGIDLKGFGHESIGSLSCTDKHVATVNMCNFRKNDWLTYGSRCRDGISISYSGMAHLRSLYEFSG